MSYTYMYMNYKDLKMKLSIQEVDRMFETDEEGCFKELVIPEDNFGPELVLTGRKMDELGRKEIIKLKKYAGDLYSEALSND